MIPAKELSTMKEIPYGEDAVDLYLAFSLTMLDIIHAAKDSREYFRIEDEEYYDRDTPESCCVLDCLEELGYTICKDIDWDAFGEPSFSTIISWDK